MARLIEMGKLEGQCVRRADLTGDKHIEHAEWLELISETYGEMFGIVAETGCRYFEAAETKTTDGTNVLSEPTDIQSLVGIFFIPSSGRPRRVRAFDSPLEYSRFGGVGTGVARRYEQIDDKFRLYPTPPAGQNYEIRFVPQAPDLTSFASDACVDVVCAEGLSYMLWGVALKAKAKKEEDVRLAMQQVEKWGEKVQDWAINRSMSEPKAAYVDDDEDCDEAAFRWP